MQGGVWTVEVIVMKVERKEGSAMVAGRVRPGISPLSGNGLNEPFSLAVGLWAIGFGEEMCEAEFVTSSGKEFGAISGASISQHALDLNAMGRVEVESLLEGGEDTGSLFIRKEGSEGNAAMIINGDMKGLNAGTWGAMSAITGGPHTRLGEASELLDVEVEEVPWGIPFVADDGRLGRFQRGKMVEAMALENAGESGFGDGKNRKDLSIGATLTTQSKDLRFEFSGRPARLTPRSGRMIQEAGRKAFTLSSREPSADGLFRDVEEVSGGAEGKAFGSELMNHFGSHGWDEFGISVHVGRGEC